MSGARSLVRWPMGAALAAVLFALALRSSLLKLVPLDLAAFPGMLLLLGVIALALLPAMLARGSPLPAAVSVTLPWVTLAEYGESKLDWLRTLKDFGVQETGGTSWPRLVLAIAALGLLWALHAADFASRLRERSIARGVPREQANAAATASLVRSATAGGFALVATVALGALVLWSASLGDMLQLGSAAFVVPLVATALVAIGGFLLVRGLRAGAS